jgi:hypothetical protein
MPDERCRVLQRRLTRREQLIRTRTRTKNEIQALLQRRLQDKAPLADLFGVKGRQWLAGLKLPIEERESADAGLRPRGGRWSKPRGAWSSNPARARVLRTHPRPARSRQSDRRDRPQTHRPVLVHAHPQRGLRPPAPRATSLELADPVEEFAYEHGARVVEPEVPA